jgi:hypothetical protein
MNHQRYNQQQNSQQNSNRFQYQNRGQSSEKSTLQRELRYLERDLANLDAQIDALGDKGRALEAAKNAHMRAVPFAIGQVALSTLGVRFLPPVARTWHYKYQQYLRSEEQLKQHALSLYAKRNGLVAQIEQIEIQIEMLQYQP